MNKIFPFCNNGCDFLIGVHVLDTFEALKMLDKVTPEMRKLGEGALPDGGLYPVSS